MQFKLPELSYNYSDLEPHIDAMTMEIHHAKHHQTYITNLNAALEGISEVEGKSLNEILRSLNSLPESVRTKVRNNGGGHFNHSMFWKLLSPTPTETSTNLKSEIEKEFGTQEDFKKKFAEAATSRFGSGWAWLILNSEGKLEIVSTPNQDNPVMEGNTPVMGLDVWEHAYYLKYQNKRVDYINAWWDVVNWEEVEKNLNNPFEM